MNGVDVFVGELFRGDISHPRAFFVAHDILSDGVQQMSLAQSDTPVEKEWVVGFAGGLGDGQRRGVGETVVVADDKCVEGVFWIEPVVAATGDGFLPFLDCVRFVRPAFTDGDHAGLSGGDFEFDLDWLAGRMHQHVLNQAQVVVFKPDLAKIVGHFQGQMVAFQRCGPNRREPEVEDVRVEHGPEHLARGGPYAFDSYRHDWISCVWPDFRRFIHPAL